MFEYCDFFRNSNKLVKSEQFLKSELKLKNVNSY